MSQPPLTPASEALRVRQHRTAVQRAVRKAFFDIGQARGAFAAAAATGREAATALVNAHLTAQYAPAWELPPPVAAQPGLAAAVARKLARRGAAAAAALCEALQALRDAQAALEAALRLLAPTPPPPPPQGGPEGASPRAAPPLPFDADAYPDLLIYTALPLAALGARRCVCVCAHRSHACRAHTLTWHGMRCRCVRCGDCGHARR
jgi:hypothetical protein